MHKASFYQPEGSRGEVRCLLCPHHCLIPEGNRGRCGVRENREGVLYALTYGRAIAAAADPVEKKPLFHFLPGSLSLSVATAGCNFTCLFCQNSTISQGVKQGGVPEGVNMTPWDIIRETKKRRCRSISYTYTEPSVFFEYALDTARLARREGLANIFVTNGYLEASPLQEISGCLDAASVDLKSFRDDFYHRLCGGKLQPVLDTLKKMKFQGVWVEVTTLIIPGYNDDGKELREIARFIGRDLGVETPWHLSRFFPHHRLREVPATPPETIHRAEAIGRAEGLLYVYPGNMAGDAGEHTRCPACSRTVIRRSGFQVDEYRVVNSCCAFCRQPIAGVFR